MSVTAIAAVSAQSGDPMQQQSGLRNDLLSLQQALAAGSLATAQRALTRFENDLQGIRPSQNGLQLSAAVNPASTMRDDMQALQSALDSGDLALAQQAFVRIQQDMQVSRQAAGKGAFTNPAASALPKDGDQEQGGVGPVSEKTKGNLVDVSA